MTCPILGDCRPEDVGTAPRRSYDGGEIPAEHGGPARLLVPHLYLWKSAKWVRASRLSDDEPVEARRRSSHDSHGAVRVRIAACVSHVDGNAMIGALATIRLGEPAR
jgi:DMSO/TMAO reductase YedYZ molybdopterin-dependent catalytic subunit